MSETGTTHGQACVVSIDATHASMHAFIYATLCEIYHRNPLIFWNDPQLTSTLPAWLIDAILFVLSIRSGSVKVETIFSEMSILYSKQRTNLTLEHGNQRLCLSNHSKNKRKLVDLCAERGIKFQKLSETLFIRRDTDGNIIQQI